MIRAEFDQEHNTVVIEFSGRIDVPQMEKFYEKLTLAVPENYTGFKLMTDLTGVESVDLEVRNPIKKFMDFMNDKKVSEIVRVIPDPSQDIGLNIMSSFHYSKDIPIITVQSREEAQTRFGGRK